MKNLADRLTVEAVRNPAKLISATLAIIAQILFGSRIKPQVKTILKKLVRTLTN